MARKINFDREEKLDLAMHLFWKKGFANTSITDLIDAMQINRFSLYNSFGDKQLLYYDVLDRYLKQVSLPSLTPLEKEKASMLELEAFLKNFTQLLQHWSNGCFIQNALIEHAGEDEEVLRKGRYLYEQMIEIFSKVIHQAQRDAFIPSELTPSYLSELILTQMQGMWALSKAKHYHGLDASLECLLILLRRH